MYFSNCRRFRVISDTTSETKQRLRTMYGDSQNSMLPPVRCHRITWKNDVLANVPRNRSYGIHCLPSQSQTNTAGGLEGNPSVPVSRRNVQRRRLIPVKIVIRISYVHDPTILISYDMPRWCIRRHRSLVSSSIEVDTEHAIGQM